MDQGDLDKWPKVPDDLSVLLSPPAYFNIILNLSLKILTCYVILKLIIISQNENEFSEKTDSQTFGKMPYHT